MNRYVDQDTIAATATAPGEAPIAIVRLSGKNVLSVLEKMFSKSLSHSASHSAHYGKILDKDKKVIDHVLVIFMKNPSSYTGEDSIEIHCHGNPIITRQILQRTYEAGARPAEPGEFTLRAFLNKKMDLTQAESIQNLICAKNSEALLNANQHLQGKLFEKISFFQKQLIDLCAQIEAYIDFPEEDIQRSEFFQMLEMLKKTQQQMQNLSDTFHYGKKLFDGISICILGTPNVGKSSLLNALLRKDRAIVTPIAGTTRDFLEEELLLGNLHFRLIDTAGVRSSKAKIEQEGIKRSLEKAKQADLILLVLDASKELTQQDLSLVKICDPKKTIYVWNKIDLKKAPFAFSYKPSVSISAKKEIGLELLQKEIEKKAIGENPISKQEVLLSTLRHKTALDNAISFCQIAEKAMIEKKPLELIAQDLRSSLAELGKIIGTDITEEILSSVFANFCIGK